MESTLRPLTLGEILDRTAQLYRENFMLLAGISSVYAGAVLVLNLFNIGAEELLKAVHMPQQLPWVTLVSVVVIFPLSFVFAGASIAANNRAVSWVHLGQPATIRGAYKSILPRLGRYLWLMTIVIFVVYIPFVILYGGYFLFLFLYVKPRGVLANPGASSDPQATIVFGIASIALLLLSIPALVYAILMGLRYSLAITASVVEDLEARKALRRSIELSKGARGRIFILGLLIVAIQMAIVLMGQAFFVVAAIGAAKQHSQLPAWALMLQQVVGFLTNSFVGPMYATGFALFYYDQRVRKEGFDIEWMMQAAGLVPPALMPVSASVSLTPVIETPALPPDAHEPGSPHE